MSFISGFFLGGGFLSSPSLSIASTQYSHIRINGACTVDKVRVLKTCLTDAQLDALALNDTYTWDQNTLLYAEFNNNLNAGNLSTNEPVTGWKVLRLRSGDTIYKELADNLDADVHGFYDYKTVNGETYSAYRVFAKTANSVLSALDTSSVTPSIENATFIDETSGEYYIFALDPETGDIETVDDFAVYDNSYSQYPATSQSSKKYDKGTFQALMGYMNGNIYVDNVSRSNDFKDFINNGHIKVYKDSSGLIMRVETYGFSKTPQIFSGNQLHTAVRFNWLEIGAA